jgi:hypothetical protein
LLPINKLPIFLLCLAPSLASAQEWTASSGASLRASESTQPGAAYTDRGGAVNASLSKRVDKWNLGMALSYSLSTLDQNTNSARNKPEGVSGVAMVSRDIGDGRSVSATLGYGKNTTNSSEITGGNTVTYTSDSSFLSSSIGLTQGMSLSRRSMATLSARYTHVRSDRKPYTNSAGTGTPASKSDFGFTTLGVGYNHRFGRYTPYVQVDWNSSNKTFIATDKDYFSINTGINYRLNAATNVGVSFSTVTGKAHSRDNTIGISLSHAF